jgi:hypothetical protein
MAPAKRRRASVSRQQFVVAKLDDRTVLAGWCVPIKDKKLAKRVGNFNPTTRGVVKLSSAFATNGEQEFASLIGGNLGANLVKF